MLKNFKLIQTKKKKMKANFFLATLIMVILYNSSLFAFSDERYTKDSLIQEKIEVLMFNMLKEENIVYASPIYIGRTNDSNRTGYVEPPKYFWLYILGVSSIFILLVILWRWLRKYKD